MDKYQECAQTRNQPLQLADLPRGTHAELLAEGGLYAHVYETQFGQKLEVLAGEPAP